MKTIIRKIAIYSLALFVLTQVVPGARISQGASGIVISAIAFTIISLLLSPILKVIGFPIKMVSFGLFPFLLNAALLFFLSILVKNVSITAFFFPGAVIAGVILPRFFLNSFLAFIASSVVFSMSVFLINWVAKE